MGHAITAFVAEPRTLKRLSRVLADADIYTLRSERLLILPVTDEVFDRAVSLKGMSDPVSADFWGLTHALAALASESATHSAIAYIETDYFGGSGTQSAMVWMPGIAAGTAHHGPGAINEALTALGLKPHPPLDAFDTLGLGEVRSTAEFAERTPEK